MVPALNILVIFISCPNPLRSKDGLTRLYPRCTKSTATPPPAPQNPNGLIFSPRLTLFLVLPTTLNGTLSIHSTISETYELFYTPFFSSLHLISKSFQLNISSNNAPSGSHDVNYFVIQIGLSLSFAPQNDYTNGKSPTSFPPFIPCVWQTTESPDDPSEPVPDPWRRGSLTSHL